MDIEFRNDVSGRKYLYLNKEKTDIYYKYMPFNYDDALSWSIFNNNYIFLHLKFQLSVTSEIDAQHVAINTYINYAN